MSVLTVEKVSHDFGGRQILEDASFKLNKGEHVGLVGANGEGKTTFLNIITGKLMPDSGKVTWCNHITTGYLDQRSTLTAGKTIREVLREAFAHYFEQEAAGSSKTALQDFWDDFPSLDNGEVRRTLAKCGLTTEHIESQVRVLSGGENAKFRLCKLMQNPMNLLVLDEPTNHLDPVAKDVLKEAVKDFKGTVILVSHEPEFYQDIVTDIWNIED